jgi:hypothetical protein
MPKCCHVATKPHHFWGVFLIILIGLPNWSSGLIGEILPLRKTGSHPLISVSNAPQISLLRLDQAENEIGYQEQHEETEDDGEEDFQSQVDLTSDGSEDYAKQSLLQLYARDREWLEKATDVILEHNHYPLGSLTPEEVEKITVLMESWVRQRSIKAAISVEKLLKRVVDDMRANNRNIHVSSKMYYLVCVYFYEGCVYSVPFSHMHVLWSFLRTLLCLQRIGHG